MLFVRSTGARAVSWMKFMWDWNNIKVSKKYFSFLSEWISVLFLLIQLIIICEWWWISVYTYSVNILLYPVVTETLGHVTGLAFPNSTLAIVWYVNIVCKTHWDVKGLKLSYSQNPDSFDFPAASQGRFNNKVNPNARFLIFWVLLLKLI